MARIRTIKPEFWSHPILGQQDDATKLLAIAILNYADDEGYFFASPAAVRSSCRPFDEDSTIVRRCLDTLVKIGYVEVRSHPTHGDIGFVTGFAEHQRIDRAKGSKIKDYFESTNNRRLIDEQSTLEQGTGNRESILSDRKLKEKARREELISFFEKLWSVYPRKDGRKEAEKAYLASVKADEHMEQINLALGAYLDAVKDTEMRFIKTGKVWFKNWQDWIPQEAA